jgi:hypothetical protein
VTEVTGVLREGRELWMMGRLDEFVLTLRQNASKMKCRKIDSKSHSLKVV